MMLDKLLLTGLLIALSDAKRLPLLDGRIIGGHDVAIEEVPYQVSLKYRGSHMCGGSIISDRYVLTAAHCTALLPSELGLTVQVGTSHVKTGGDVYDVERIYVNDRFDMNELLNDISLLRLKRAIEFKAAVQPIALIERGVAVAAEQTALVTGWGVTEAGDLAVTLKGAEVRIVDRETCRKFYERADNVPDVGESMICAADVDKDSCQGDSGGPLVSDGKLVGIVSWGLGCANPKYPGVYTNVAYLRDYVANVTGI